VQQTTAAAGDGNDDGGGNGTFHVVTSKKRRRPRHGQKQNKRVRKPTEPSLIDQVINAVASQGSNQLHNSDGDSDMSFADSDSVSDLYQGTDRLRDEINQLKSLVVTLQQQVDFLLSAVGITQPQIDTSNPPADTQPPGNSITTSSTNQSINPISYAAAASNGTRKLQGPVRDAILAAVYSDMQVRENMKNNVVIYGMPPRSDRPDRDLVLDLCQQQLGFVQGCPLVQRVARLGKTTPNKVQPLLVALRENGDTQHILNSARSLRRSGDEFIRNNVYISAQQTRAERQAAYEERCRRRQQTTARQQRSAGPSQPPPSGKQTSDVQAPPTAAANSAASHTGVHHQQTQQRPRVVFCPPGQSSYTITQPNVTTVVTGLTALSSSAGPTQAPTITTPAAVVSASADVCLPVDLRVSAAEFVPFVSAAAASCADNNSDSHGQ